MSENPIWFSAASFYAVMSTIILCHFGNQIAKFFGLLDHPTEIKLHSHATPLLGGLALFTLLIPLLPIFTFIFEPSGLGNRALTVIVVATLVTAFLGTVDDRRHLGPILRFALTLLIFFIALELEPRLIIDRLRLTGIGSSVTLSEPVALTLTLLIYVGFVNCVNMADGKNGLVIGLSILWLLALLAEGPTGLVIVALPLLQTLGVLLIYNLRGRLFLGDGGTYGLSSFIGMISVYCYNIDETAITADALALLYLMPGLDMLRLVFGRAMAGRSPFNGDRDHLHHFLKDQFGWPKGLLVYLGMVAVPVALSLLFPKAVPYLIVSNASAYFALLVWLQAERRAQLESSNR